MKRIFISYAHEDAEFRDAFVTHLQVLRDAGIIESWHDGEIQAGADWQASVDDQLRRADIVVLLVSADFLASKSCQELELAPALGRWEQNLVTVIPIIVRSCAWEVSPVGRLQALPTNGKPIATWPHADDAWTEVIKRIREMVTRQLSSASSSQPQPFPTFATLHSRNGGLVNNDDATRKKRRWLLLALGIVAAGATSLALRVALSADPKSTPAPATPTQVAAPTTGPIQNVTAKNGSVAVGSVGSGSPVTIIIGTVTSTSTPSGAPSSSADAPIQATNPGE